ncbi:MAG: hypothetical protein HQ547_01140 [Candidatus Omnitrophica bacterium]|nr:hypothetical protein [Candidatus Omnitrophota bacterium]
MTLLIGANLNHCTVIAADTRTSWRHPLLGDTHTDGDHKIAMCTLGLVTGSGYVDALDPVKKELLSKEIMHTDQILTIVQQKALPKIEELRKNNLRIRDKTCFLLSYCTISDNAKLLRLALIHPDWEYKLAFYDSVVVAMPSDSSEEESIKYNKVVTADLIRLENKEFMAQETIAKDILVNLYSNVKSIAKHFHEISKKSKYVSPDMDFAALLLNGAIIYGYGESSEIMKGIFRMSVIPPAHQTQFLTPELFKKGNKINI